MIRDKTEMKKAKSMCKALNIFLAYGAHKGSVSKQNPLSWPNPNEVSFRARKIGRKFRRALTTEGYANKWTNLANNIDGLLRSNGLSVHRMVLPFLALAPKTTEVQDARKRIREKVSLTK